MKGFIISIIIFAAVLSAVIANNCYVHVSIEELMQNAQNVYMDQDADQSLTELISLWERKKAVFALSANFRQIDSATEHLLSLKSAHESGNSRAVEQYYLLFCNALQDIRRYEKISIENIL